MIAISMTNVDACISMFANLVPSPFHLLRMLGLCILCHVLLDEQFDLSSFGIPILSNSVLVMPTSRSIMNGVIIEEELYQREPSSYHTCPTPINHSFSIQPKPLPYATASSTVLNGLSTTIQLCPFSHLYPSPS